MGIINAVWGHLRFKYQNETGILTINGKCEIITRENVIKAVCGIYPEQPYYSMLKVVNFENADEITTIDKSAFHNCRAIKNINIPSNVKKIDDGAFGNCTGLSGRLTLPSSLEYLGKHAFSGCSALTGSLILPKTMLTYIREFTFSGCTGLSGTIEIPPKVTYIDSSAFFRCTGIEKVILHENIIRIGEGAFMTCSNLKEIYCNNKKPPRLGVNVFYNVNKNLCKLIIPKGDDVLVAYKGADQWREFKFIEQR